MHMHTASGWQDEPADWEPSSTSSVSDFGVSVDTETAEASTVEDSGGLTTKQETFVQEVIGELKGTGMAPDEAFQSGLEGLIGKYQDRFDRVPDATDVEEAVYAEVAHLDVDALDN